MSLAGADTPFVAPYGGILHIYDAQYPPNIYKRSANPPSTPPQLPDSSYLIVELADSTHEFLVSSYFGSGQSVEEDWEVCGSVIPDLPLWYYEAATGWAVGRVHAGDTVRFTFHGEYVNPPEEIFGPFGDSVWLVILDTPRPPGCDEPNDGPEWCQFYVKIFPAIDTVVTILPPNALVIDGEIDIPYTLEISPDGVTATSFSWSWEPKDTPAGNNPFVRFLPDSTHQSVTVDTAKWYAFPDDTCACELQSTYLLRAEAVINNIVFIDSTKVTVYLPDTLGKTPGPKITFNPPPTVIYDAGRWRLHSQGGMTRVVGTPMYNIPNTSQFYNKTVTHEDVHVYQQTNGIAKHILSVDTLWNRLRGLAAPTQAKLVSLIYETKDAYVIEQDDEWMKMFRAMEIEAFEVSDPIPPTYRWQRQCTEYRD